MGMVEAVATYFFLFFLTVGSILMWIVLSLVLCVIQDACRFGWIVIGSYPW